MRRRDVKLDVQFQGSTLNLHPKLATLRLVEVSGISGVGVKSIDIRKNTCGEGGLLG